MKVFVYFNLHKKVWSVRDVKTRKVIMHTKYVMLSKAKGKVSEAGRQRVLKEKKKNVHAGIEGFLISYDNKFFKDVHYNPNNQLTYNPYKYNTFVWKRNEQPFIDSEIVYMDADEKTVNVIL